MSTEVVEIQELSAEQRETLQRKQAAWNTFAEAAYRRELSLQGQVNNQIAKIKPVTVDQLPAAESTLKEIKQALSAVIVQRKEITSKFDQITERMMQPEKSLQRAIEGFSAEIIAAKREHEKIEQAKRARQDELKRVKEYVSKCTADHDHKCRALILERSAQAFEHALKSDIKPADVHEYVAKIRSRLGVADFHTDTPSVNAPTLDLMEVNQIMDEHWRCNSHAYDEMWKNQLIETFANYPAAYANKQAAIEHAAKQAEQQKLALETETENKKVAAEIETSAQSLEVSSTVKALKKAYELDMPETAESALLIWKAYAANRSAVDAKLRISKWLSATPAQIGAALAKCKSDDNALEFHGITFKQIDKL